jgi:hypothetical protein
VSYSLDQDVTSTTQYVELRCPGAGSVTLQITNGAVWIGFGESDIDPGYYPYPDEPFLPVIGSVRRRCDRVRVKARAPISSPAPHVMITAVPG